VKLSEEGRAILSATNSIVPIIGYAGAGKTSLLVEKAEQVSNLRINYIAYNNAMAKEAKGRFPRNTVCKTMHSLAYGVFGYQFQDSQKLRNLSLSDINRSLGLNNWTVASSLKTTLQNFMNSASLEIEAVHIPLDMAGQSNLMLDYAGQLWQNMTNLNQSTPMPHDGYLKLWQMTRPILNGDIVMLDEAQDANPIFMDVALHQHEQGKQVFIIGDPHQQIYRFRGANNAFEHPSLKGYERYYLSQSYRFGSSIAQIGTFLLKLVGETVPLKGSEHLNTTAHLNSIPISPDTPENVAVISRTVAGTLDAAIKCLGNTDYDRSVKWVGGIEKYNLQDILDVYYLSKDQISMIQSKQLTKDFPKYSLYAQVSDETLDPEMVRTIRLLDAYGDKLPELFRQLHLSSSKTGPCMYVSTAHRVKGLEFDYVVLNDDFKNPFDILKESLQKNKLITKAAKSQFVDEINLKYVATTRAMKELSYNNILKDMLNEVRKHAQTKKSEFKNIMTP
jgi:superfamily I DNA/RNA helicase